MERQATKEEIPVEKRVKSRKPYIPKHLRREVNKEELEGFHKRVPKDMSFEVAYHKYKLGNFFRERAERLIRTLSSYSTRSAVNTRGH
ncbi:unnamed protein product [Brassica oleracea]